MPGAPALLRLRGIGKRFGAVVANRGISLDLQRGEVLALLGENGAGKSTLVSILYGHYVADEGSIEVDGRPLAGGDTAAALAAGIGMVHQHFTLADNLSVLDNVMLGTEPLMRWRSRRAEARTQLAATAARFGLHVDADARVGDLSVGERQRVEILKVLTRGARLLILDEPTAVLTPPEVQTLFGTLQKLVHDGLAVIFISHKLDEVLAVSQRIAVLRGGELVATVGAAGADKGALAALMVGREVARPQRLPRERGAVRLALRDVAVARRLERVTLDVHAGEIVAIAGVAGNGQRTLAAVLFGMQRIDAGSMTIDGRPLPATPRACIDAGIARIPEDRQAEGSVGDLAVWENTMLERPAAFAARGGWLDRGAAKAHAERIVAAYDVRGLGNAGLDAPVRALSGGNLQKLILGRALGTSGILEANAQTAPPLIVAEQPTWGLDVGAVAFVHQQLLDAAARGAAVLLISEDLDEIRALADRIGVMHRGRLGTARPPAQWTHESIGLAMAGHDAEHGDAARAA